MSFKLINYCFIIEVGLIASFNYLYLDKFPTLYIFMFLFKFSKIMLLLRVLTSSARRGKDKGNVCTRST